MSKRTTVAPAITRVHKLFRIRTIVNESRKYLKKRKGIDQRQIGRILVDRKLSKTSILESPNKLKRARDHALNACLLGLFVPIPQDHEFLYAPTPIANELQVYKFEQECPNDLHETSVFIDRMMKLKLTNAYDSRHTYAKFHTRPFLSVLTAIKPQRLHLSQVHYLLGQTKDLATNQAVTRALLATFSKYPSYEEDSIERFIDDFELGDELTRKEMSRSTKPLLDWMRQGGLLTLDSDGWCSITENGSVVAKFYSQHIPIWHDSLGFNAALPSAVLTVFHYASITGLRVEKSKLDSDTRESLTQLSSEFKVWDASLSRLTKRIDFDANYDVPYELREDVVAYSNKIGKRLGWKAIDLNRISTFTISEIEDQLRATTGEREFADYGKAIGIVLPRRECFQTEFEWQVCVRLRLFQFPAIPYQGEFEGETDLPMATDNPDVVLKNSIRSLIECKSRKEWGEVVKYDKRVSGELYDYQNYAEEVKADSAIFICDVDGFDEDKFINPFIKRADKLDRVGLVCWSYLDKAQKDTSLLERFRGMIENPKSLAGNERILCG